MKNVPGTHQVPVVKVPLGPTPLNLCQVLGQGQNTEGEEERPARITLVNTLRAEHYEATVCKEGSHPRIASECVGQEPGTMFGHGVEEDLALDRVKRVPKVQLE